MHNHNRRYDSDWPNDSDLNERRRGRMRERSGTGWGRTLRATGAAGRMRRGEIRTALLATWPTGRATGTT